MESSRRPLLNQGPGLNQTKRRNKAMQGCHRLVGGLVAASFATVATSGYSQSADALIDKLADKAILTVDEATQLREETDHDFTKACSAKTGMPDWVTSIRFSGDVRGRFDGIYGDIPGFVDRARWRYRLRAGFTISMMDNLEVGFRLGSGDS